MNKSNPIPAPGQPRPFNFPDFKRLKLNNGLQVFYVQHDKLPLINLQLCIKSGAADDFVDYPGIAVFHGEVIAEGTKKRTSKQISIETDRLGLHFSHYADWNASYLEMNLLEKHLEPALELFSDILANPLFPENEVDRLKKQKINQRLRSTDNPGKIAVEKFSEILFRGNRYGLPMSGKVENIKSLNRSELVGFYQKHFNPDNAVLVVVGSMEESKVIGILEKHLGGFEGSHSYQRKDASFSDIDSSKVFFVHKKDASQSEIRLGHLGISRNDTAYFPAVVLNQVLGGYFLSRLNMNLREKRGLTYGVHSRFVTRKDLGPFLINAAVDSQKTEEAVVEIINEIKNLQNTKISDKELEQAKGYMTGIFPIAFESGLQIASGLSNIAVFDLADDYYQTYREKISAVTTENVLMAAQNFLKPEKMVIAISGNKDVFLKKSNIAYPLEVTDFKSEKI